MSTSAKKKILKKSAPRKRNIRRVKDYSNDPYFVKKDEESKAFLEKNGFPAELLAKIKK